MCPSQPPVCSLFCNGAWTGREQHTTEPGMAWPVLVADIMQLSQNFLEEKRRENGEIDWLVCGKEK